MTLTLWISVLSCLAWPSHLFASPIFLPLLIEFTPGQIWPKLAAGGVLLAVTIFFPSGGGLDSFRQVAYATVRCGWCRGKGTDFLLFRCRVCSGHGRVMAAKPQRRCAWCKGKGREMYFFRCRVCRGTGWAHGRVNFD
ncbi:MAG TPA: hypothetical protein PKE64_24240 [Anaerolineae bacterium]|nr:hypothetical protein [Anaerolineae bacterium]HMR67134.1 hypothetical protein [Anaerolineae bacterium]